VPASWTRCLPLERPCNDDCNFDLPSRSIPLSVGSIFNAVNETGGNRIGYGRNCGLFLMRYLSRDHTEMLICGVVTFTWVGRKIEELNFAITLSIQMKLPLAVSNGRSAAG